MSEGAGDKIFPVKRVVVLTRPTRRWIATTGDVFRGYQGDRLSCLLFNIAHEGVIQRAGIEHGMIFPKTVQLLGFANDIDVIARDFALWKRTPD